jgi:8-oxo-dGTP pyrophosphatase MutT (NUDIX family)
MGPQPQSQTSAGGIIVRRIHGRYEVCLTLRQRHGRAWGLPKGHLEAGEDAAAAAIREVQEETGLCGVILESLGSITYQFTAPTPRTLVTKTVHFYLMGTTGGRLDRHDRETVEARWMAFDEAMAAVAHDDERRMLERATQTLARPEVAGRLPDAPAA